MSVEEMLKKIMTDQDKLAADVRNNQLATQNLEKQLGLLDSAQNSCPQGGIPGNTYPNPKQVNIIITHSGKQLEELAPQKEAHKVVKKDEDKSESNKISKNDTVV